MATPALPPVEDRLQERRPVAVNNRAPGIRIPLAEDRSPDVSTLTSGGGQVPPPTRRWEVVCYALRDWRLTIRLCMILAVPRLVAAAPVFAWIMLHR